MGRPKRSSITLEKAERRSASLQSISKILDFGDGLSVTIYNTMIDDLRDQVSTYNTILSTLDKAKDGIRDAERRLTDFSERMLTGVATRYGKDSPEYKMAGGIRKSDRKPRTRKATKTVESAA